MSPRVLLFSQHLLGIGHYVRAVRIADALGSRGFDVVLVSGGMPVPHLRPSSAQFEQLPPIRAQDESFATYVTADGTPVGQSTRQARASRLRELHDRFDPNILIVEAFPFGRRSLRSELLPLIAHARRRGELIVCSIRDILVPRRAERDRETVTLVNRYFDLVLVHGDPNLVRLEETFPSAGDLSEKIRYTGYIAPSTGGPFVPNGEILVSAGGGIVGRRLLELAIEAKPLTRLDGHVRRLVAGHALPDAEVANLRKRATADNIVVEQTLPDFASHLRGCRLSISQAGYNTVIEVLASGIPAVCMPFAAEGETEQTLRCTKLERRGYLQVVPPEGSAKQLAAAIGRALSQRPRPAMQLDLSGAEATASIISGAIRI